MRNPPYSGFTLIELSIVIVIIALISGGVLVGRDLILTAQARHDVSLIDQVRTGVQTFKLKYNALPGDMPNPGAFFVVYTGAGVGNAGIGNGNGVIGNTTGVHGAYCARGCAGDLGGESTLFWLQLAQSQLINLAVFPCCQNVDVDSLAIAGIGYPSIQGETSYGLSITSVPNGLANIFIYGAFQSSAGQQTISFGSSMDPFFSSYIDSKTDDGNARSGRVQNKRTMDASFAGATCHDAITGVYSSSSTPLSCTLRIESGF